MASVLVKSGVFLLACICLCSSQTNPNVILVITDDQGYGEIGAHGNTIIQTPNLDTLHGQSVRLTNFHVDPTCSPTRAALMTGQYSRRTGVWHTIAGRSLLRGEAVTMAEVFEAGGYATGMFGKWHLGDNYPMRPEDQGFQHAVRHGGGGVGQTPDYWGNDYFDDTYWRNSVAEAQQGYCTDVWFSEAMSFIEANRNVPFFVYLSTNAAHSPFNVDASYSDPYQGQGVNANFYGMITNIDENMGKLMNQLDTLGLADTTILIFMTDNGSADASYNAGLRAQKGSVYDGGHRVPFFIRWPGGSLVHGTDLSYLTAHFDMLPTLITLANLQSPDGISFDGMDLSPYLRGMKIAWPERTLMVESQRIQDPEKYRSFAVMTDQWRLVNNSELYDITADLDQSDNVASQNSGVVQALQAAYDSWWDDVSQRDGEYTRIHLGSDAENPVVLTAHDWHAPDGQVLWNQGQISNGCSDCNGWWAVRVMYPGAYNVSLRRWPAENPGSIGVTGQARVTIGNVDQSNAIPSGAEVVVMPVELDTGNFQLQTWLGSQGAFYVYVERTFAVGCMDVGAINYDPLAEYDDGSCIHDISVRNGDAKLSLHVESGNSMLKITVHEPGQYTVDVFDVNGVKVFGRNIRKAGDHEFEAFDKPGIYYVKVAGEKARFVKRVVAIK
jgi:arylsulfatase A-like enzyme